MLIYEHIVSDYLLLYSTIMQEEFDLLFWNFLLDKSDEVPVV